VDEGIAEQLNEFLATKLGDDWRRAVSVTVRRRLFSLADGRAVPDNRGSILSLPEGANTAPLLPHFPRQP
jgi:hypothetical protein